MHTDAALDIVVAGVGTPFAATVPAVETAAATVAAAAPVVLKHHAVLDTGDRVEDVASTHLGALV